MNIFVTNSITSKQYNEAMELIEKCAKADGTRGISFLEQELNAIEEFPCFYMMYDGSRLVSYLSVFIKDFSRKHCCISKSMVSAESLL